MNSSSPETASVKYWPFELPVVEKFSEEQSGQINFLKLAFEEGFSPCVSHNTTYQISKENKGARIIYRGPRRWELLLGDIESVSIQAYVSEFTQSADAALSWMRNEDVNTIASKLRVHLAHMPKGMEPLIINS